MSAETVLPNIEAIFQREKCSDLLKYAKSHRDDGIFNDVKILAGSFIIGANRMVLSCYSTFFEKMFMSEMKERYESSITIKQIDATAIQSLVDYMYEGTITVCNTNVTDILAASDFLLMTEVKEFCINFLQQHISLENWYNALSAAKLYRSDRLLTNVYQFITDHLDNAIQSKDFKIVTEDDLTSLISTYRKGKIAFDESGLCKLVVNWTKQDEEKRKEIFVDLLDAIDFRKISSHEIENLFAEEDLVRKNLVCANAVLGIVFSLLKNTEADSGVSKIICAGGRETGNQVVKVFDILKATVQSYPNLSYDIEGHCLLKWNKMIFCIGGRNPVNDSDVYNKVCQLRLDETNWRWSKVVPMKEKRCLMGAAVFQKNLVVVGGWNGKVQLTSTEYFSHPMNEWQMAAAIQQERNGNALVVCNDSLFTLGGWGKKLYLSSVEQLQSLNSTWKFVKPMLTPRFGVAAVSLDGCIYAIGGRSGHTRDTTQNTVERYDPYLDKWTNIRRMKNRRIFHVACVLNRKIFVIGGVDGSGNIVDEMEVYDPKTDEWIVSKSPHHQNHFFYYSASVAI